MDVLCDKIPVYIVKKISVFFIRRKSDHITHDAENEKPCQFRDQKKFPFSQGAVTRFDI